MAEKYNLTLVLVVLMGVIVASQNWGSPEGRGRWPGSREQPPKSVGSPERDSSGLRGQGGPLGSRSERGQGLPGLWKEPPRFLGQREGGRGCPGKTPIKEGRKQHGQWGRKPGPRPNRRGDNSESDEDDDENENEDANSPLIASAIISSTSTSSTTPASTTPTATTQASTTPTTSTTDAPTTSTIPASTTPITEASTTPTTEASTTPTTEASTTPTTETSTTPTTESSSTSEPSTTS